MNRSSSNLDTSRSDVSILLQQVQDSISAAATMKRSNSSSSSSSSASSSNSNHDSGSSGAALVPAKRGRALITSDDILGDDIINPSNSSKLSLTESRKQQAELAEARLRAQEEREKHKLESDERQSDKSRYIKQLQFLEGEVAAAKKALSEKSEAFETEKAAMQEKVRKLEAKLLTSTASSSNAVPAVKEVDSTGLAQALAASDAKWRTRLEQLDAAVRSKSEEVVAVKKLNAVLEDRCTNLEQQVLNISADVASTPSFEGGISGRDLANKVAFLESSLREKTRALERLERKLQNHQVLEMENESLKSKLSALKDSSHSVTSTQEALQRATTEREEWMAIFRDLLKNDTSGYAKTAKISENDHEIPIHALRMLKRTQETAAVHAKTAAEFEASLAATKRRLAQVEAKTITMQSETMEAKLSLEKSAVQCKLLSQQTQLYEKEVLSLRDLLKSFDAEFSIGRPDGAAMLKAKDDMIESLRSQLDNVRGEARVALRRLQELEANKRSEPQHQENAVKPAIAASASEQAQPEKMSASEGRNYEALVASLRDEIDKLKYRLHGFQVEFGADYISSETRVIHMIANPSNNYGATRSEPVREKVTHLVSTRGEGEEHLSIDNLANEMRQLREENRRLKDAIIIKSEGNANASMMESDVPTGGGSNASMMSKSTVDSEKLNMRLKAMFKERISCFREAVYLLTGYKIDLYSQETYNGSHPRLKLRSVYAEDPDDFLIFQWRGDSLELLETPFATKIDKKIFAFLTTCHSVPAFLSNVTLDLFEKQTFMG